MMMLVLVAQASCPAFAAVSAAACGELSLVVKALAGFNLYDGKAREV